MVKRAVPGLEAAAVAGLKDGLRGQLIQPDDPGYQDARKVYNGMIDARPALIARCANAADVIQTVRFARESQLLLAIRGGGHNGAGLGTCDGGLVVDLSPMKGVRVDPASLTARVDPGCTLGDVDHATHAFGLATPFGILSTAGVSGLTLGGGIGHLTRKYGLSIDNLLEVDVVLADSSLVTANAGQHQDLFWAVRGGGGNFGVVTSLLFKLSPVGTIWGGPTFYELDQTDRVMRWYREFLPQAPHELNGFFAFVTVPPAPMFPSSLHLKKMCAIVWCYCGAPERAEEVVKPAREFGPPALDGIQAMPFPMLQSAFDALYPPGLQWYWRTDFVNELSDAAITAHGHYAAQLPTLHSTMHLYPVDGSVHRVGRGDTAFGHRDAQWAQVIVGVDPDPASAGLIRDWATQYWEALHPYSARGGYINFMMNEGPERIQATYRDNYERLARIKRRYDPDNFFRVNQNIPPARD
jgi:FAD/FMN-containing dehydrogenase